MRVLALLVLYLFYWPDTISMLHTITIHTCTLRSYCMNFFVWHCWYTCVNTLPTATYIRRNFIERTFTVPVLVVVLPALQQSSTVACNVTAVLLSQLLPLPALAVSAALAPTVRENSVTLIMNYPTLHNEKFMAMEKTHKFFLKIHNVCVLCTIVNKNILQIFW